MSFLSVRGENCLEPSTKSLITWETPQESGFWIQGTTETAKTNPKERLV